jgi:hypothetical protein
LFEMAGFTRLFSLLVGAFALAFSAYIHTPGTTARPTATTPPKTVVPGTRGFAAAPAPMRGALIQVGLGTYQPMGAWGNTYAGGGILHLEPAYKTSKNWIWSLQMRALYGMRVKIDSSLLGFLTTEDNQILGLSGSYAEVRTEGRGTQLGVQLGKVVPMGPTTAKSANVRSSGLDLRLGAGWLQHRILFFNPSGGVPMVYAPYRYGLDRLHRGYYAQQSIGYLRQARNNEYGWSVALEFMQARLIPQRGYNYDTRLPDTQAKWDFSVGVRALYNLSILRAAAPTTGPRFYVD